MSFNDLIGKANAASINRFSSGVTATVGTSDPLPVIFDAPFKGVSAFDGTVESSLPAISGDSAAIAALGVAHGTALTVAGTINAEYDGSFSVIGIEPDGAGMTKLLLEKA